MPRLAPGQRPAHLVRLQDAAALTARIRPVGSISRVVVDRGITAKQMLDEDAAGMALVEMQHAFWLRLVDYQPVENRSGFLVQYVAAAGCLRTIRILSIDEKKKRFGNSEPKFMVETEEGTMVLRDSTVVVLT